jgi:hypothetical protein
MIKKYVLKSQRNNQIISEDIFELVRSKKNRKEIHVIERSTTLSTSKKVIAYETDKSDREIIEHFDKKYKEYQEQLKNINSVMKQMKLVSKFDREFDLFFGKPVGEDIKFFGQNKGKSNEVEIKKYDNQHNPLARLLSSSLFFTVALYIWYLIDNGIFDGNAMKPLYLGLSYFGGMFITITLMQFIENKKKKKEKNNK